MSYNFSPRVITDSLVLYLDAANTKSYSGSGTTWTDLSRGGNSGVLTNGVTFSQSNGGIMLFDGIDDFISVPDSTSWDFTSSFTIESWVYITTYDTGGAMIIHQQNGSTVGGFEMWVGANNAIYLNKNSSVIIVSTGNVFSRNVWQHVVCTHNGTTAIIYLNGINVGQANGSLPDNVTGQLRIGSWANVGSYELRGRLSNLRIYNNKSLTSQEVLQNYNALKNRFISSLTPIYEALTYTSSANMTLTNNGTTSVDMFKTSGSNAWDNQVYSLTPFTAPCTIEFNKQAGSTDNGVSYAMIGWNVDPTTNASYASLDYASYPFMTSNYYIYNNSVGTATSLTWNTSDKFYLVYDTDGFIRHYNGSTLLYSANYGVGNTVYVDSSFYSVNTTYGGFSNVKVCNNSWNGLRYV
jgi:hypothetical protein